MLRSFITQLAIALVCLGGLLCSGSCGRVSPPAEVMLLISTDLAVPTDVDTLHVTVTHSGEPHAFVDDSYPLRGDADAASTDHTTRYLPGTFALVSSDTMRGVVLVHLELRLGSAVRVQRDAELEIPSEGVKQLPMPLDFLCNSLAQACAVGMTCQAGKCVDETIANTAALDDYVAAAPSQCFNAAACFLTGAKITGGNSMVPDMDPMLGCSIKGTVALDAVNINVALIVNTSAVGNLGFCDQTLGKCLVPLEKGPGPGDWRTLFDPNNPSQVVGIGLPQAVCDQALGIAVFHSSSLCPTKSAPAALCQASASGACIGASGVCPPDWFSESCSGSLNPFCGDPPCTDEAICGEVVTDPAIGPTVPGLWCCTLGQPTHPDDPLLIDDMSSGPMVKLPPKPGELPGVWFTNSDDMNAEFFPPLIEDLLFPYRTIDPPETPAGGPTISHAACLQSDGFTGNYALEGFDFYLNSADYSEAAFDVSPYTGIRFWAKANVDPTYHRVTTTVLVKFPNADTDGNVGVSSACKKTASGVCNDDFGAPLTLTQDWTLQVIKWADLMQGGYGEAFTSFNMEVYSTIFVVPGLISRPFDFCIAQIEFTTD
jgi:hypothetical protein